MDLNEKAPEIVVLLRRNGFEEDYGERQALGLVEEAGEMTGAYRRWTGRARRSGTASEFEAELADVVITSYVTAAELGFRLDVVPVRFMYRVPEPCAAWPNVLDISRAVTFFVTSWLEQEDEQSHAERLKVVVEQCYQLAGTLGIDLDAAIERKLAVIFSRGWREPVAP